MTLEENYCFDAEVYADEADIDEKLNFREDQRSESFLCQFVISDVFRQLISENGFSVTSSPHC